MPTPASVRATNPQRLRCQHVKANGDPCGSWAMHGHETCYTHSMSAEEWQALSRRAQEKSVEVRRRNALARKQGSARHAPDAVTLACAMWALRELLTGTLDGVEPNLEQRALGLELFQAVFRQPDRDAAFDLLRRRVPRLAPELQPDLQALKRFEGARERLREQLLSGEVELGQLGPEIRELLRAGERGW